MVFADHHLVLGDGKRPEAVIGVEQFEHPLVVFVPSLGQQTHGFQRKQLRTDPVHRNVDVAMEVRRVDFAKLHPRDSHRHLEPILVAEHALRVLSNRRQRIVWQLVGARRQKLRLEITHRRCGHLRLAEGFVITSVSPLPRLSMRRQFHAASPANGTVAAAASG